MTAQPSALVLAPLEEPTLPPACALPSPSCAQGTGRPHAGDIPAGACHRVGRPGKGLGSGGGRAAVLELRGSQSSTGMAGAVHQQRGCWVATQACTCCQLWVLQTRWAWPDAAPAG